jgi:hypothetical protein
MTIAPGGIENACISAQSRVDTDTLVRFGSVAFFVYFSFILRGEQGPSERELIEYPRRRCSQNEARVKTEGEFYAFASSGKLPGYLEHGYLGRRD